MIVGGPASTTAARRSISKQPPGRNTPSTWSSGLIVSDLSSANPSSRALCPKRPQKWRIPRRPNLRGDLHRSPRRPPLPPQHDGCVPRAPRLHFDLSNVQWPRLQYIDRLREGRLLHEKGRSRRQQVPVLLKGLPLHRPSGHQAGELHAALGAAADATDGELVQSEEKCGVVGGCGALHAEYHGAGAARAMEDVVFIGGVLGKVARGNISFPEAVKIYEEKRLPRAWTTQQIRW
jgi:hypothetical protein